MSLLQNSNAISSGLYTINNSLRFRSSASAYLSRTPASAGSTTIGTFSNWLKLGAISTDRMMYHVAGTSGNNNRFYITFNSDNTFQILGYNSAGSVVLNLNTTQVLRDPSAWYNIVVAIDTTQATSSNRAKLYINGTQVTAFSTATYPSQNQALGFTNNTSTLIGANQGPSNYFDGYMADVYFIDGSAKTPSDFGETDTTTGVWKPKAYTGTYGTNGFYLKFSDIATTSGSNAGLGKDFSSNSNYWTTNNISVTAGTTYDAMTDVPTNTSATVGNFCVVNPLKNRSPSLLATYSEGNLKIAFSSSGSNTLGYGTMAATSGKWYWEATILAVGSSVIIGIADPNSPDGFPSASRDYSNSGNKDTGGSGSSYGASYTTNDVIGVALDIDNGTIVFYKNGVSQGTAFTDILSALPAGGWTPFAGGTVSASVAMNFGQRPFSYTPPTGYVALNTYNLPTPTILQGNKYMDATLYTGNGSTQTIVNASQFKPDLVWVKARSSAYSNALYDSVRGTGTTKSLLSNDTASEGTYSIYTNLTSFNSNGFTAGSTSSTNILNENAVTFVGWQWQAGQGTTSSNTSGSITSTVSVNTTAGFSIVTYTGTGANATVGHGLGVAPSFTAIKCRNDGTIGWVNYHASLGNTKFLNLNNTNAAGTGSTVWNNTSPTSTTIALGTDSAVNGSTKTYVAYCFAEIAGFSKFTSYTGNGSADGPFVYLGFRPKYVMTKRTDTGGFSWYIMDSTRTTINVTNTILEANTSSAEYGTSGGSTGGMDFLSNGVKIRNTGTDWNASGGTYIVAAFAENPFKNSLAR